MNGGQRHGKEFELEIRDCGLFPGASADPAGHNARFDIDGRFDPALGLPTSIKATGNAGVMLADARRFWQIETHFRMIVGCYRQRGPWKEFDVIHEFLLGPAELGRLRGSSNLAAIERLHRGIGIAAFPRGQERAARAWFVSESLRLHDRNAFVGLRRKIDGRGQRRVQCEVPLARLAEVARAGDMHRIYDRRLGDLTLPLRIASRRRFDRASGL